MHDQPEITDGKELLIESFESHKTYVGKEIRTRIAAAKIKSSVKDEKNLPTKIKRGYVLTAACGSKIRPVVVVKQIKDKIVFIPMTSGENIHSTIAFTSRFFGEGYFSLSLDVCTVKYAKKNFVGIFGDNKSLRQATDFIKTFINRL